jgi:hypothetical protein
MIVTTLRTSGNAIVISFAEPHLELGIVRSIEGILRLAGGGDTLPDDGSAAVALLARRVRGIWRSPPARGQAFARAGGCLLRSVRIFRGRMLIFMQHTCLAKRLFMEVRPLAVAAVRDSQQQRMAPIPRMEWGFYGVPLGQLQV